MKTALLVTLAVAVSTLHAQTPPRQTQEDDYTQIRAAGAGQRAVPDLLRSHGDHARGAVLLQHHSPRQRRHRRARHRPVHRPAVEVGSRQRQRRAHAGHPTADPDTEYIKVHLARPVPQGGEARLLIDKTYKDAKSYFRDGETIVFDRSLGIRRNTIVLPAGYRLVSCNVPSQVIPTPDGRLQISFMNSARPPRRWSSAPGQGSRRSSRSCQRRAARRRRPAWQSQATRLSERAYQDREIVYFLNDPTTNSFSLYHDYTESRPGVKHYFNVVRAGSRVSNPSAKMLDTGENLKVETLKGDEIKETRPGSGRAGAARHRGGRHLVSRGDSRDSRTRLRISETYTDPGRYYLEGEELVWDRAFGRPRNAVVLPAGWTVVASSIPGQISEDADGRQRLYFENPRPDEIQSSDQSSQNSR